jgi:hypothetical protein
MFPTTIPALHHNYCDWASSFCIILGRYGAAATRSICPFDGGGRFWSQQFWLVARIIGASRSD